MASKNISQEICEKCKFWNHKEREKLSDVKKLPLWMNSNPLNKEYGECRRFPPALFKYSNQDRHANSEFEILLGHTSFPLSFFDSWCGEFKTRLEVVKGA